MGLQNNGKSTSDVLQNRFTAYLLTALKRRKRDYINKQMRLNLHEIPFDFQAAQFSYIADDQTDRDRLSECIVLMQALYKLTARERYILFEHILNGNSYDMLARVLGLQYNGVSTAYHRIIQKLRKELGGDCK